MTSEEETSENEVIVKRKNIEMKPMDENQNALSIRANIYVERQSQKKIIYLQQIFLN